MMDDIRHQLVTGLLLWSLASLGTATIGLYARPDVQVKRQEPPPSSARMRSSCRLSVGMSVWTMSHTSS